MGLVIIWVQDLDPFWDNASRRLDSIFLKSTSMHVRLSGDRTNGLNLDLSS